MSDKELDDRIIELSWETETTVLEIRDLKEDLREKKKHLKDCKKHLKSLIKIRED